MSGFVRFLGKEFVEIARTWRLPVVGGVAFFFALTGPILALMTPQLIESMQSSQPGVVIQIPEPIWRDAYVQWVKNLSQIVAFVTIIAASGAVAGEVASGTAMLVLTKPVSRAAFVVAKALSLFALIAVTVLLGTAFTQVVTFAVFGEAPAAELWGPTLAWLVFAALLVSVSILLSTMVSTLAAAGIGVGIFFAISLSALWGPAVRYTPAGLVGAPSDLLMGGEPALVWPVATALATCIVLVALGAWTFSRREL